MNCDECLNSIEEYLDGDLDIQSVNRELTHLLNCRDCELEFKYLQQERKVFKEYQNNLKTPTSLRVGVIEKIKAKQSVGVLQNQQPNRRLSFSTLFRTWRVSYLAAGLAAAILVGIPVWFLLSLISRQDSLSANSTGINYSRPKVNEDREASETGKLIEDNVQSATIDDNSFDVKNIKIKSFGEKSFARKGKSKSLARKDFDSSLSSARNSQLERKGIKGVTAENAAPRRYPVQSDRFETVIAKQLEQAQLLLRSFKNTPITESSSRFEVAYDSRQAGELLQKNILLRRSAKEQGNFRVEEMLDDLEPYLMDIANLRDDTAPAVIREVKSRIREREIVATLQVYSQQPFTQVKYGR